MKFAGNLRQKRIKFSGSAKPGRAFARRVVLVRLKFWRRPALRFFTRCARLAVVALPKPHLAQGANMADIERINVKQARERARQALLVCAYENEAKYRIFNLDGSISLANFRSRLASLPKTQEIIFY